MIHNLGKPAYLKNCIFLFSSLECLESALGCSGASGFQFCGSVSVWDVAHITFSVPCGSGSFTLLEKTVRESPTLHKYTPGHGGPDRG